MLIQSVVFSHCTSVTGKKKIICCILSAVSESQFFLTRFLFAMIRLRYSGFCGCVVNNGKKVVIGCSGACPWKDDRKAGASSKSCEFNSLNCCSSSISLHCRASTACIDKSYGSLLSEYRKLSRQKGSSSD